MWSWASSRHCRNGLHAAQNGRLLFFLEEKTASFFSFYSFLFRRKEAKENQLRNSCFSVLLPLSPTCCTKRTSSFLFRRKNGQLAREAQALRRTDAGTSCVVVGRNTTAGMPPSSALSLPVSAAPARQLSRANRPCKRKSSAEQLLLCAFAAFVNVLHKTDGSHTNRPFLCSKQNVRENTFSPTENLPRSVFCFFSSRKENVLSSRKEIVPPLEK